MRTYAVVDSAVGGLFLIIENHKLAAVHIGEEDFLASEDTASLKEDPSNPLLQEAARQMKEYFSGYRTKFELPLERIGTKFQLDVWNQLSEIPFGVTKSYQEIAEAIGRPKAVRAVGQANKANKLPIIIPCHRVIGKNHTLTGYAGTRTDIKDLLLRLEGARFKPAP
jgi:methylated-DNA-[protein]-cysteine S-methyltransferase